MSHNTWLAAPGGESGRRHSESRKEIVLKTANLISTAVLALAASLLAGPVRAGEPGGLLALAGSAVCGQTESGGTTDADMRREVSDLLDRAREEMDSGNLDAAENLIKKAEAVDVSYGPLHVGDTPKKARKDLDKARASATRESRGPLSRLSPMNLLKGRRDAAEESDPFGAAETTTPAQPAPSEPAESISMRPFNFPTRTGGAAPLPPGASRQDQGAALLIAARKALAVGDTRSALESVGRAQAMGLTYDSLDDSPAKVEAAIRRQVDLMAAIEKTGGAGSPATRREQAQLMLEQAEALRRWSQYDDAERLATDASRMTVDYGPYDVTPQKLLDRIAESRRTGTYAGQPAAPGGFSLTGEPSGGPVGSVDLRKQASELVGRARSAMEAGDLLTAERLAGQAQSLGLPPSAFGPGEDQPGFVLSDIARSRSRGGATVLASDEQVIQAGNMPFGPAYPETSAVYNPANDPTRVQRVGAQEPVGTPAGAPPTPGTGMQLFQDGEAALRSGNGQAALSLFQQANVLRDELDPTSQQRLRTYLLDLSRPANPAAAPGAMLENLTAEQEQLARRVSADVAIRENAAREMSVTQPKKAMEMLQEIRQSVETAGLDPASRDFVLRRVDRSIGELGRYIEDNRGRIELDERNQAVRDEINRDQELRVKVQNDLAKMVDDFNRLMDERRFAEAELLAKKAQELAPLEPVVVQMVNQVKFVRRTFNNYEVADLKERGVVDSFASVERSSIPFDDSDPYIFPDARRWGELSELRKSMLADMQFRRSDKELEIQQKLKTPVSLQFKDAPLSQVLDYLARIAQVNLHVDEQGLAEEGVQTDTPVTIDLSQDISMKSALNLILEPLNLGYVIEDEVLKVTSEHLRGGKMVQQTYNVADLVIPIPNFMVNSSNLGLSGAYNEAMRATSVGGPGFASHAPLSVVASTDGAPMNAAIDPALLAQMAGNSGTDSMAAGVRATGGAGPGGMGGGSLADFDSLIDLITSTIAPTTWDEVGGPGSIQPFATNLSIVVSNTQDVHQQIVDLLEQLRRLQDLQVTIEVRFITLNDNFFERIGVDFDFDLDDDIDRPFQVFGQADDGFDPSFDNSGATPGRDVQDRDHGPRVVVGQSQPGVFSADLDIPFAQGSFPLAVPQFGGFQPGAGAQLGFAILSDIEAFFFIEAAQGDRRSNVLQAPKVTLFNGQTAFISDTSQSPFVISVIPVVGDFAAAQQPVIVILSEGTFLTVSAIVTADRRFVRLTVVPFFSQIGEVSTFTFTGSETTIEGFSSEGPDDATTGRSEDRAVTRSGTTVQLPTFSFVTVTTTVSVPDGGTVLLGGIKRLSEGRNEFGVPMLNKLPYLNRLFSNVGIGRETQSLMMMVTPRIIIQEEEESILLGQQATP
jgi:general secretion pathway protein D